ncbi:MAG: DUF1902 domain-containing protein [Clostridia bacterium]|nr:DUF1902 domain-containing protein [Clostridia bacterium]
MLCNIKFRWDAEEAVWIATSDDVPGLVLESGSFDALLERVKLAVPELIVLNGTSAPSCRLSIQTEREELVAVNG